MASIDAAIASARSIAELRQEYSKIRGVASGSNNMRNRDGEAAANDNPAKKLKVDPLRRTFVWSGVDTGTGEEEGGETDNFGHLTFTDHRYIEFHGELHGSFLGGYKPFHGYKIGVDARRPISRSQPDVYPGMYPYMYSHMYSIVYGQW